MPVIQPASVLLSDHAAISAGSSAATLNAPIWAHACAAHIASTPRFSVMASPARRVIHVAQPVGEAGLDQIPDAAEHGEPLVVASGGPRGIRERPVQPRADARHER